MNIVLSEDVPLTRARLLFAKIASRFQTAATLARLNGTLGRSLATTGLFNLFHPEAKKSPFRAMC